MRIKDLGVAAACWLGLASLAPAGDVLLSGEDPLLASPAGRLAIGRADDYVPSAVAEPLLKTQLNSSMKARRDFAWSVVEQMLVPTILTSKDENGLPTTIKVPRWQTWYEGLTRGEATNFDELTPIITAYLTKLKDNPTVPVDELIDQVLDEHAIKDLKPGLTDANFQNVLNQNLGTATLEAGDVLGGKGFTLFSPSFVAHMLREARNIADCQPNVAAATMPTTPDNFSHCFSHEFPRSAVTIKTTWQPLDQPFQLRDTTPLGVDTVIREGTWPGPGYPDLSPEDGVPDKLPVNVLTTEADIYTNVSTGGRKFGLTGIHFVTKDVREWVWVSLWWDPNARNEDFGADQPASIAAYNGGVWRNYKMCVNTGFVEGDPAPGSHYSGAQQPLGEALEAAYAAIEHQIKNGASKDLARPSPVPFPDVFMPVAAPHDVPTQWCSNPYVESHWGNGRTSCIGCHQIVFTRNERRSNNVASFFDIMSGDYPQFGRAQARNNFPGEFVWSFTGEFRPVIRNAVNTIPGFAWP